MRTKTNWTKETYKKLFRRNAQKRLHKNSNRSNMHKKIEQKKKSTKNICTKKKHIGINLDMNVKNKKKKLF